MIGVTQLACRSFTAAIVVFQTAALLVGQAAPLSGDFCQAGEAPVFEFGFLTLANVLGNSMGTPIECPHADSASGDTLQATTTGLAFHRQSTNTPTFTDGYTHWALTDAGLVTWTGSTIDPPGLTPPPPPSAPSAPMPPPDLELPPPSHPLGVWTSVSVEINSSGFVAAPQYPTDNRLFRIVRASASPYGSVLQMSNTQGRTWDQVSVVPCGPASQPPLLVMPSPTFAQDQRLWLRGVIGGQASLEASNDGARTWTSLTPPLITATVRDLAASGSATGRSVLLLAMDDNTRVPSGRYFRSTDLGHSWQEITEAFRDPVTFALPALTFQAGVDPDRVYATTTDRDGPTWYSADSAASWRNVSERPVEAVTATGCGVLLSTTGLELSCDGAPVVVAPAPPDTSPRVLSAASFVDQGTVLAGARHGLWVFPLRP